MIIINLRKEYEQKDIEKDKIKEELELKLDYNTKENERLNHLILQSTQVETQLARKVSIQIDFGLILI